MPEPPLRGCPSESPVVLALSTNMAAGPKQSCPVPTLIPRGLDTETQPLLHVGDGASVTVLPRPGFLQVSTSHVFLPMCSLVRVGLHGVAQDTAHSLAMRED